jgi:peptide/nickel transport system substrate-binding protein
MFRRKHLAAIAAAVALTAAGCGGGTDEDPDDDSGQAPVAAEADLDGTLRYGASYGPSSFDTAKSAIGQDATFLQPVYDRLVHSDPDGTLKPGLALTWTVAAEPPSVEFELRPDVTFTDGTAFDANVVKANIDRLLQGRNSLTADLFPIQDVEVTGPLTVRFNLKFPSPGLPAVLNDRGGMMISPQAFDNPNLEREPVGTGPYKLVSYQPNAKIVYERNDDHWEEGAAAAKTLEVQIQPNSSTRLDALRSGQLDFTFIDAAQVDSARDADLVVYQAQTLGFHNVILNKARSKFGDVRVRRALNMAIDRASIIENVSFGFATDENQVFPEGSTAHDPSLDASYDYDPEGAKELLAEAGAEGLSFELTTTTSPDQTQMAQALQAQWEAAGIDAQLKTVEPAQIATLCFVQATCDAMFAPFGGRIDAASAMASLYSEQGFANPGRVSTPAFEQALAAAAAESDPAKRDLALQKATRQVFEDALAVVVQYPDTLYAARPRSSASVRRCRARTRSRSSGSSECTRAGWSSAASASAAARPPGDARPRNSEGGRRSW